MGRVAKTAPVRRTSLANALFSATQQRVLGLLFGQPNREFGLSELIRQARSGSGAVQREIERLRASGLIITTTLAGRKLLQANQASPIFQELRAIIEKTTGVAAQLRTALEGSPAKIPFAALFGSVAKGTDTAASDIDVLIVSDGLTLEEAYALFRDTEERLGRRISPTIYTTAEFAKRRRSKQPFLTKVLSGDHVVLTGAADVP